MVGAVRTEKSKASKCFERKVRFLQGTSEVSPTATPVKPSQPRLVAGAETHRNEKRRSVSAARRRSRGLNFDLQSSDDIDAFFNKVSTPYPKTPMKKKNRSHRSSLPIDIDFDMIPETKSSDLSSSPFAKTMGKPDITDFSEAPDMSFYMAALSRNAFFSSTGELQTAPITDDVPRRDNLEEENKELRQKYDALYSKYQRLSSQVRELTDRLAANGVQVPDQDMFDADDEFAFSFDSASFSGSTLNTPGTPIPSLASSLSTPSTLSLASPVIAEVGTPAVSPALPVRVIDEDYDEGWNAGAARRQQIRTEVSHKLGLTPGMSTDETLDKLADALADQVKLADNSVTSDGAPNYYAFPPLPMPPMPQFEF